MSAFYNRNWERLELSWDDEAEVTSVIRENPAFSS